MVVDQTRAQVVHGITHTAGEAGVEAKSHFGGRLESHLEHPHAVGARLHSAQQQGREWEQTMSTSAWGKPLLHETGPAARSCGCWGGVCCYGNGSQIPHPTHLCIEDGLHKGAVRLYALVLVAKRSEAAADFLLISRATHPATGAGDQERNLRDVLSIAAVFGVAVAAGGGLGRCWASQKCQEWHHQQH